MTYEAFEYKYGITPQRAAYLVAGTLRHLLSDAENEELDEWIGQSDANEELFTDMVIPDRFEKETFGWYKTELGVLREKVLRALLDEGRYRTPLIHTTWFRIAAAVIIAAVAFFAIEFFSVEKDWRTVAVTAPTLISPDGRKINLKNIGDKPVPIEGGGVIWKKKGDIYYSFNGKQQAGDRKYVMQVPEFYIYNITLPDGTKIWLKAISGIRFPESFSTDERIVEVSGGVYVEVAGDKRPFIVKFSKGEVNSNNGHFGIDDRKGESPVIVMAKGNAELKTSRVQEQLRPGYLTTLGQSQHVRHERIDVDKFTIWRFGVYKGAGKILDNTYKNPFDTLPADSIH